MSQHGMDQYGSEQQGETGRSTEGAKEVIGTAGQEVSALASEAAEQVRDLASELGSQVREAALEERDRASRMLGEFTQELQTMRSAGTGGYATQVVDMMLTRARSVQSALDHVEPQEMTQGIQRYARMRPGVFLSGAVVLGFVVGRVTRAATSSAMARQADQSPRSLEGADASASHVSETRVASFVGEASTSSVPGGVIRDE